MHVCLNACTWGESDAEHPSRGDLVVHHFNHLHGLAIDLQLYHPEKQGWSRFNPRSRSTRRPMSRSTSTCAALTRWTTYITDAIRM